MATATLVPLEQYLHTSYEPECEWVDGVLKEKSMPDEYHGYFQLLLAQIIDRNSGGRLRSLSEVRVRISASSYRVPDVLAVPSNATFLPKLKALPLICLEVLSPDDRIKDLLEKIDDYLNAGVPAIWIVDPRRRTLATADAVGMHEVDQFVLDQPSLTITSTEVFADLDRLESL